MDKIRVSLWWGITAREGNTANSGDPEYSTEFRMGIQDRAVAILRFDDAKEGVSFHGPLTRGYQRTPSAISISFRNMLILSVSDAQMLNEVFDVRSWPDEIANAISGPTAIYSSVPRRIPTPTLVQPIWPLLTAMGFDVSDRHRLRWNEDIGQAEALGAVYRIDRPDVKIGPYEEIVVPTIASANRTRMEMLAAASVAENLLWLKQRAVARASAARFPGFDDAWWSQGVYELMLMRDQLLATAPPWVGN
jgi:hypothetical protein